MFKKFRKNTKGGPLIEFSFSALLLIAVILGTVEFGVEMFVRNTTERLTNRAAEVYAITRDISKVENVFMNEADLITRRCLKPVDIRLFDEVSSVSVFDQTGRVPAGDVTDETAVAFQLLITCDWPRITPTLNGMLGAVGGHKASIVLRFKD
jgi:Flp pilus assembly protein TadG